MVQSISARRFVPMLHLLWKELLQVRALAMALLVLGALIYLLLWLWGSTSYDAVSVLLPNLFALGAPVLMIGHEEETGTLAWSRSLPIGWRSTWISKWLVAVVGLAMAWGVSFFCYQLTPQARLFANGMDLMSSPQYLLTFSLTLLACGFMLSWWLRKPIPTLLLLVALMALIYMGCFALSEHWWGHRYAQADGVVPLLAVAAAVMAVASVFFARRTWTQPWSRKSRRTARSVEAVVRPYRPTEMVPLVSPGARFALLWQHARQTLPIALPAFVAGAVTAALPLIAQRSNPLLVLVPVLAALLLGGSTFLTDNTNGRHRFLAERGFSAWTVWWTRQLIPIAMTGVIMVLVMISWSSNNVTGHRPFHDPVAGMLAAICAAFVAGQFTAMVVQRPTLALLCSPLTFIAMWFATVPLLQIYSGFRFGMWGMYCLGLLVMWMATLRLCRRWLDDRRTLGFYSRVVGWVAAAALVALVSLIGQRWATTPAAMPQWKQQALATAAALPALPAGAQQLQFASSTWSSRTPSAIGEMCEEINGPDGAVFSDQTAERLKGHFQSLSNLDMYVGDESQEIDAAERRRAELYAELIEASFNTLERYRDSGQLRYSDFADGIELQLFGELSEPHVQDWLGQQRWEAFVERLATPEQRREARRRALLRSYQDFARPRESFGSGDGSGIGNRLLGGYWVMGEQRHIFAWERFRTRRLVDHAVRISLEELDTLQHMGFGGSRWEAWWEVWEDTPRSAAAVPTRHWHSSLDQAVLDLKAQLR